MVLLFFVIFTSIQSEIFSLICAIRTLINTKSLRSNVFVTFVGGVYNTDVEGGQKRKRFSCFACGSEIRHPHNGWPSAC